MNLINNEKIKEIISKDIEIIFFLVLTLCQQFGKIYKEIKKKG